MVSNKIVNLANPTSDQDAATRNYVDTKTTNMATTSSVSTAITTALGMNGTQENNPSINDTGGQDANFRLVMSQQSSGRAYLYRDSDLFFNASSNTLSAGTFSGAFNGSTGGFTWLEVTGTSRQLITGTRRFYDKNGTTTNAGVTAGYDGFDTAIESGNNPSNITNVSIRCSGSIWIQGSHLWVTSDQRIKTNIVNLNTDKMINVFRHLRPISFDYIDPMKNYNKKHFGFIAQEVNEILPEGISLNTDVIPNNMMKGDIAKPSETDEPPCFTLKPDDTDITLQYLLLTTDSPLKIDTANPYSSKDTYKFKIYGGDKWAKEHDIYIRSEYNVTDDKYTYVIGMKKEAYDVVITESTLFVYGQYVNDLHILDHDTIYTVATAALQEVDKQQQADKARISELEATVAAQQSLINDILERLKNAKI